MKYSYSIISIFKGEAVRKNGKTLDRIGFIIFYRASITIGVIPANGNPSWFFSDGSPPPTAGMTDEARWSPATTCGDDENPEILFHAGIPASTRRSALTRRREGGNPSLTVKICAGCFRWMHGTNRAHDGYCGHARRFVSGIHL